METKRKRGQQPGRLTVMLAELWRWEFFFMAAVGFGGWLTWKLSFLLALLLTQKPTQSAVHDELLRAIALLVLCLLSFAVSASLYEQQKKEAVTSVDDDEDQP